MVKIKDEAIEMFLDPSEQGEEFLDENELEGQFESEEILYEANKDQNRGKTGEKLKIYKSAIQTKFYSSQITNTDVEPSRWATS